MEALTNLVRNIAIILLLASFMEMLLPNNSMRGYVRLVIGLFIISALINPITNLLHMPLEMQIPAWNVTTQKDLPVIADGQKIADPVQDQYQLILSNQIRALALGVKGVGDAKVDLAFKDKKTNSVGQPELSRVDIFISQSEISIEPVQPVIIGTSEEDTVNEEEDIELAEKVRERIVSLMQIPEELVIIHLST